MNLIQKIISWLKKLFKKIFNKKEKKIKKKSKDLFHKNSKIKANINKIPNDTMPSYMVISSSEKEKLLYSIELLKNLLEENYDKIEDKRIDTLINDLKNNKGINKEVFVSFKDDNKKILNSNYMELIINELSDEEKKDVINNQKAIIKDRNDFTIHLNEIDKIIDLIIARNISVITENAINKEISNLANDKKNSENIISKIDKLNSNIYTVINNIDEEFLKGVLKEYHELNYVTISTIFIDQKYEEIKKLKDDFKNHRYNKYYYEREINQIKQELNKLKNLKNRKDVNDSINSLKKELYTKSKDKYDILYNNEVFMNLEKECDNLLGKINVKVIDIKKEKDEKKDDNEYLENVVLRFKDLDKSRKIILLSLQNDEELANKHELQDYVNYIYNRYNSGLDVDFNFDRNKNKTELVILYNGINIAISKLEKKSYIPINHINFQMCDLIEAIRVKKEDLNILLNNREINNENEEIIDNKIDLLSNNDNRRKKYMYLKKNDNR